jgi:hypothetical protein
VHRGAALNANSTGSQRPGRFEERLEGKSGRTMLAAALVLIVLGLLSLLIFPWGGIAAAAVGLLLLLVYLFGAGRAAARATPKS